MNFMRWRRCAFVLFSLMFALVTNIEAAPVISALTGTISAGQEIVIEGRFFGQKTPAPPLLWDSFEGGTSGNLIENVAATVGSWEEGAGSDNVYYSSALAYSGSTSAVHTFSESKWNSSLSLNETFQQLYLHFKRYYPAVNGIPSNYKPYRLYGDNDNLQLVLGMGCEKDPYQVQTVLHQPFFSDHTDWSAAPPVQDTWQAYEVVFKESSIATDNGTLLSYVDGKKDGYLTTTIETRRSDVHLTELRIGHYFDVADRGCGKPPSNAFVYTDDVYVDTTWSRVMICEGATWSSRGVCEMQIPLTWSQSSIHASANPGHWSSGTIVYVYVADALNVANNVGFEVLIGENSGGGGGSKTPSLFLLLRSVLSTDRH